jgi:hypothetical protein
MPRPTHPASKDMQMAIVYWFNAMVGIYSHIGASLLTAVLARMVVNVDHHAQSQWRA